MTTLTLTADNSTDAAFRAWGSAISGAIAGLGMVQTADTGQVNWTTVLKPSGSNQVVGYEIWRFADALQATAPIYFKLEYGSNVVGATTPGVRITVGTGSDGAGTITGTYFAGISAASGQQGFANTGATWNSVAATTTVHVNGHSGALCLLMWPAFTAAASSGAFVVLERTHNFDGTDNADGYSLLWSYATAANSGGGHRPQSFLANSFTPITNIAIVGQQSTSYTAATNVVGTAFYPIPIFTGYNLKIGAPSQWAMAYPRGDYAGNQSLTISHYGTNRTWLTLGMGYTAANGWGIQAAHATSFLIRISS